MAQSLILLMFFLLACVCVCNWNMNLRQYVHLHYIYLCIYMYICVIISRFVFGVFYGFGCLPAHISGIFAHDNCVYYISQCNPL